MRARSFSERFPGDHPGPRYGPAFRALRRRARAGECYVVSLGYRGPGHEECHRGTRLLFPTAIHLGRYDAEGLLLGCGAAHDLADGLGSRRTRRAWEGFLAANGINLRELGLRYFSGASEEALDLPH